MAYNNIFLDLVKYLGIILSYNIYSLQYLASIFKELYSQRNSISIILLETFFRNSNFYRSILDALSICSRFPVKRS